MTTNNGGPAFPVQNDQYPQFNGMSLRDWFAGQALAGYFAHETSKHMGEANRETADYAYKMADAMLAAREATE